MTLLQEIGRNVALLRQARGLTQEETAYRANISVSRLQVIEYGRHNTTVDTLIRIANGLGIDQRVIGIFTRSDQAILNDLKQSRLLHGHSERIDILPICRNIRLLRKERGLTQRELAQLANLSAACLRDIEHGCANMTIKTLMRIAEGFGLSMTELFATTMEQEELLELVYDTRKAAGIDRS